MNKKLNLILETIQNTDSKNKDILTSNPSKIDNHIDLTISLDFLNEAKEDRYPKIGPFYFYKNRIIAPDEYQKRVNPVTHLREFTEGFIMPGEHRDMWDRYMVAHYPELKTDYDDDHKALPRGRVDYSVKNNHLNFLITLDSCIKGREDEIKKIYLLQSYSVRFSYGALNYQCKYCRK